MLISIIIPFKERFDKVKRALLSVENQSYKNIEVILVNDASEKIFELDLNEFKLKIIYIQLDVNHGPGGARNEGLRIANGDFVAFLDSDDYWHPEFLEKILLGYKTEPDATFLYSHTIMLKNGQEIGLRREGILTSEILPTLFSTGRPWSTGSCLWNKKIIDKIGEWSLNRCWEDYEFDTRAAIINNKVVCVPLPLFYCDYSGADKLSSSREEIIILEKSKSMFNISNYLKKSIFRQNSIISSHFLNRYLGITAKLIENREYTLAYKNLKEIQSWSEITTIWFLLANVAINFRLPITAKFLRRSKLSI